MATIKNKSHGERSRTMTDRVFREPKTKESLFNLREHKEDTEEYKEEVFSLRSLCELCEKLCALCGLFSYHRGHETGTEKKIFLK